MATLYIKQESELNVVTARSLKNEYNSSGPFKLAVDSWLADHNINYKWAGESVHSNDTDSWYLYSVYIYKEHDRTLFNLRWA
jgi:hypothetical protein